MTAHMVTKRQEQTIEEEVDRYLAKPPAAYYSLHYWMVVFLRSNTNF
jgi:hypothetical protein